MQILMLRFLQPEFTLRPWNTPLKLTVKIYVGFFILPILLLSIQTWMQMCFHYVGLLSFAFQPLSSFLH